MRNLSDAMRQALQLLQKYKEFYLISQKDRIVWMAEDTRDTITRRTMSALVERGLAKPIDTGRGKAMVPAKSGERQKSN